MWDMPDEKASLRGIPVWVTICYTSMPKGYHMKSIITSIVLIGLASGATIAGSPVQPWVQTFGDDGIDIALDSAAVGDDFFLCGFTDRGEDRLDLWIARIDRQGETLWERSLGGPSDDLGFALQPSPDGGVVIVGSTCSFGEEPTRSLGGCSSDGWIVKLDGDGNILWQNTYGTDAIESFVSIAPSPDGFYVGGMIGAIGSRDTWVLEIDGDGQILWQRTFAGVNDDQLRAVAETPDGLVFTADSRSIFVEEDFTGGRGIAFFRPWAVRLDGDGDVIWSRTYDVTGGDSWRDIVALDGGGFIVTGEIFASDFGGGDLWLVRLNELGELLWENRLGNNLTNRGLDEGNRVLATSDGGFVALGTLQTNMVGNSSDFWVAKFSSSGEHLWDKAYGGTKFEQGMTMTAVGDEGFLIAGRGQFIRDSLNTDALVMLIFPDGTTGEACDLTSRTEPVFPSVREVPTLVHSADAFNIQETAVRPTPSLASLVAMQTGVFFCMNASPCPGDCDGSGTVDFNDLVSMLFLFGTDPGDACDADQSGEVDFNDLVTALFVFGPCEKED